MIDTEPSTEGASREFAATAWSLILLGRHASLEEKHRRLETLARRYWKPIYLYIRSRWRRSPEDAADLTQQFFVWMLETEFLDKVQADRGRFRNFVKTAVSRFVMGQHDAERRLKRGGGAARLSLDFIRAAGQELPAPGPDPEAVLDQQWKRGVLEEALLRLRQSCEAAGKPVQYRVFEEFHFAPAPGPSYDELAGRHGLSTVDVANLLARAKARYRALIEEVLAEGVTSADDLRREFEDLFGSSA